MKSHQIMLYYHFNKIAKGPGTCFQSSALNQKYIRKVFHTAHYYLTKFYFDSS